MLIVTLGDRHCLVIDNHPTELDFDSIFECLNRVSDPNTDLEFLARRLIPTWCRRLRLELDVLGAPSMSVGDKIFIFPSIDQDCRAGVICRIDGWDPTPPCFSTTFTTLTQGRKVHFALDPQGATS